MSSEQNQTPSRNPSNNDKEPPEHKDAHDDHTSTTIVDTLLRARFSCRYFHPTLTPSTATLTSIFETARHAPSGRNL
jgi:hypothetical protein